MPEIDELSDAWVRTLEAGEQHPAWPEVVDRLVDRCFLDGMTVEQTWDLMRDAAHAEYPDLNSDENNGVVGGIRVELEAARERMKSRFAAPPERVWINCRNCGHDQLAKRNAADTAWECPGCGENHGGGSLRYS